MHQPTLVLFGSLLLFLGLVTAVPVQDEGSEDIIRLPRQAGVCTVASDCYPPGLDNISPTLIDCVLPEGRCSCDQCFTRNSTGQCGMTIESPSNCYYYDTLSDTCIDNRKSQVAAFVLSITLSGLGVANFYIGQDGLGAGQLVLFLFIFVIICLVICTPFCAVCCLHAENIKGSIVFICFTLIMILLIVAILIGIWGWWIADAVIFGLNERNAGDGCPLKPW